jgi:hypothetical protein
MLLNSTRFSLQGSFSSVFYLLPINSETHPQILQ